MKGKRFLPLVALAAMSLVACGGQKTSSSEQKSEQESQQQTSSSKESTASSSKPSTSKSEQPPVHTHAFAEVAAEAGEDYKVMKCECGEKYLMKLASDVTAGTQAKAEDSKFGKGETLSYTFTLKKDFEVNFQIGFKMSSSSHSTRKFQTDAEGASTDDPFESNPENNGTQRFWLEVNGERVEVTNTATYGDNGMNTDEFVEVVLVDKLQLSAGVNIIKICSHTNTGYRLFVGGEVRLGVAKETEPVAKSLEYKSVALKEVDGKAILSYEHEFAGYTEAQLKALTPYFDAQENPYAVTGGWAGSWNRYTNVAADSPLNKGPKAEGDVPLAVNVQGNKVYFDFDVTNIPVYKYTLHLDVLNSTVDAIGTDNYADFKPGVAINQTIEVGDGKYTLECVPSAAENGGDGAHFWGALGLIIESNHKHNFTEAVEHAQGEGEVAEEIKQCAKDGVYQIAWDVQDAAKVTSGSGIGADGKLASGGAVEYKFYSPENLKARLYLSTVYNSSNYYDRETDTGDNSVYYSRQGGATGWKMEVSLNGREVLQEKQSIKIGDEDIPLSKLMFKDFVENPDGSETELPYVEFNLKQGVNTIKFARKQGYSLSMKKIMIRGEKLDAAPTGITLQTQELILDEGKPTLKILGYYDGFDKAAVEAMPFSADLQRNANAGGSGWDKVAFGEGKVKIEVNDNGTFIAKFDLSDYGKDVWLLHFEMNKANNPGDAKLGYAIEGQSISVNGLQYTLKCDPKDTSGAVSWGCSQITIADEPIPEGTVMLTRGAEQAVKFEAEDATIASGWKNSGWTDGAQFIGTVAEETEKGYTITASGDKFTTASTGGVSNAKPFEITVHADEDGILSMKVACARGARNNKTTKDMNLSHVYEYKLDGETGKFEFASPDEAKILAKDANNYEWVVIEWKAEVKKGTHVIQGFVSNTAQNDAAGTPCLDYFLFDLQEEAVEIAQPVGGFHGMALAADNSTMMPIDLYLTADSASLSVNGSSAGVTAYNWDKKTGTLTLTAAEIYGTITAVYNPEKNTFGSFALTGAAAAQLSSAYAPQLSGNALFLDCEIENPESVFLRRKNDGSWSATTGKMSIVENGKEGKGLQVNGWADGKIGLNLAQDLPVGYTGEKVKALGVWIYNPSASDITVKFFIYKDANFANNANPKDFTLKAGQWTFCQVGLDTVLGSNNLRNIQFFLDYKGVNLVYDSFCIYM